MANAAEKTSHGSVTSTSCLCQKFNFSRQANSIGECLIAGSMPLAQFQSLVFFLTLTSLCCWATWHNYTGRSGHNSFPSNVISFMITSQLITFNGWLHIVRKPTNRLMFGSCHVGFLGCYHTWSSSLLWGDFLLIMVQLYNINNTSMSQFGVFAYTYKHDFEGCICKS